MKLKEVTSSVSYVTGVDPDAVLNLMLRNADGRISKFYLPLDRVPVGLEDKPIAPCLRRGG